MSNYQQQMMAAISMVEPLQMELGDIEAKELTKIRRLSPRRGPATELERLRVKKSLENFPDHKRREGELGHRVQLAIMYGIAAAVTDDGS